MLIPWWWWEVRRVIWWGGVEVWLVLWLTHAALRRGHSPSSLLLPSPLSSSWGMLDHYLLTNHTSPPLLITITITSITIPLLSSFPHTLSLSAERGSFWCLKVCRGRIGKEERREGEMTFTQSELSGLILVLSLMVSYWVTIFIFDKYYNLNITYKLYTNEQQQQQSNKGSQTKDQRRTPWPSLSLPWPPIQPLHRSFLLQGYHQTLQHSTLPL